MILANFIHAHNFKDLVTTGHKNVTYSRSVMVAVLMMKQYWASICVQNWGMEDPRIKTQRAQAGSGVLG